MCNIYINFHIYVYILTPPLKLASDKSALFPSQSQLLSRGYLESDSNWLICAPTGAGKTRMAEWALEQSVSRGFKGAYLAPLKAIVDERMEEWSERYTDIRIGLFTGETTRSKRSHIPTDESILLFTPEKLAAYLQNWKKHLPWLAQLDSVVIDEIHLLGDPNRGATLETLIGRLQRINPFVRIIGLSGTLSNGQEIAEWMKGQFFTTTWRPVPVDHRIRRFKRITDKEEIALEEVRSTLSENGKVLIFVNSRRRSEKLARWLTTHDIKADCNHAGLTKDHRTRTQQQMRYGELDVVVATSTLEMGVNFPARKVIIYDAYGFDGERFTPLTIQRYRQSAGRAGRAGYDTTGEAVLLLPNWHRDGNRYLTVDPEPVRSSLFTTQNLLREILTEIAGRLSISEDHLETNFAERTLWRKQDGQSDLSLYVKNLVLADLIKEKENKGRVYLSITALGRIAVQMSLSPLTAQLIIDFLKEYPNPSEFDLLLISCLTPEVTPKLGFNFEEIDQMTDVLLQVPSTILDRKPNWLLTPGRKINEKKILSAIKCAVILHQHIHGEDLETLAINYDCYSADLSLLKNNIGWILDAATRIFNVASKTKSETNNTIDSAPPPVRHAQLAQALIQMVAYGIPRHALGLVKIKGIGSKRAQALVVSEIYSREQLLSADQVYLSKILKLRRQSIEKILGGIEEIVSQNEFSEESCSDPLTITAKSLLEKWPTEVDPYRLRRAFELKVDHQSAECMQISGGTEPHQVTISEDGRQTRSYTCDCIDFQKGNIQCKHVLRSRLEHDDGQITELVKQMKDVRPKELRFSLGELWMKTGRTFDSFNGRNVDYGGAHFMAKANKRRRDR